MTREIRSYMPGTVWKIEVSVGDEVDEDDTFLILESMKMEMPISAEFDCIIKEILVTEGQTVKQHQPLLIVEKR